MTVTQDTVIKVAKLARMAITEDEANKMEGELNEILAWVEQLQEVNVDGVEPMTAVVEAKMRLRTDNVTAGEIAQDVVKNAPAEEDQFFMVPKVVE